MLSLMSLSLMSLSLMSLLLMSLLLMSLLLMLLSLMSLMSLSLMSLSLMLLSLMSLMSLSLMSLSLMSLSLMSLSLMPLALMSLLLMSLSLMSLSLMSLSLMSLSLMSLSLMSLSLMSLSLMSLLLMSLLMLLLSLFLAGPSDVVVVSALCLPLADEVDVVVDRLAAVHVLPLPDVLPALPHHNAVLCRVCGGMVAHPTWIVAVRASIAPHPGALGGTVGEPNESFPTVLGHHRLHRRVLVCRRDNSQSEVALVCATRRCIAPAALAFPHDIALGSIRVHRVPTRTGCVA